VNRPQPQTTVPAPHELAGLFESSPMAAVGIALMDERKFIIAVLEAKRILETRAARAERLLESRVGKPI
jgi:hypothetical protein